MVKAGALGVGLTSTQPLEWFPGGGAFSSPAQLLTLPQLKQEEPRCTILDAWGWCTGTTQRDGMGREEGGGFGMGNTYIPVADSF